MEISGTVIETNSQKGISKTTGRDWVCKNFIVEYMEGTSQKRLAFELFGEERIEANPFKKGQVVTVSFDIESMEWNGRWFTKLRAWRVRKFDPTTTPDNSLQSTLVTEPQFIPQTKDEELPF